MKKTLFVISGILYSGAEVILLDFLKRQEFIDPYFLLLQQNELIEEEYSRAFPGRLIVAGMNLPNNRINRLLTCKIDSILYKYRVMKTIYWADIKESHFDLLYLNNSNEIVFFPFESLDMPKIGHIHDNPKMFRLAFRRQLLEQLNALDAILAVSRSVKNSLIELGIQRSKVNVVYNAIDIDESLSNDEIKIPQNEGVIRIGFVGGLIKRKGPLLLMKAANLLDRLNGYNIEINFAANYKEPNVYRKITRFKTNTNITVKFYENLERDRMKSFYRSMDLIVVPSYSDPLPTVILEAVANGKLVLASNVDGIPELVNVERLLFRRGDYSDLAAKINEILSCDKKTLSEIYRSLRDHIANNFNYAAKIKKLQGITDLL